MFEAPILASVAGLLGPWSELPEPAPMAGSPISAPEPPRAIGLGHGGQAQAGSPRILFMNFDGAQLQSGCGDDSKNDCSRMAGRFDGEILPYAGNDAVRASIGQAVRSDVVDFGVIVTDQRPEPSEDYAMVLIGDSAAGGSAQLGFAGVAPTIDCGDSDPNETSFALAVSYTGGGMATVILQEAAHTWGLEHTDVRGDNLFPTSGGVADPKFLDECMKVVEDTRLNPTDGVCNSVHTDFCDYGYQNSYQEMLWLFGGPVADTTAPTVTIEEPADGAMLPHPADFDLVIAFADEHSPQMITMRLFVDGGATPVYEEEYPAVTLKFPVAGGFDPGTHTLRVEGLDEAGNAASDEITIVLGEGSGESGSEATDASTTSTTTSGTTSGTTSTTSTGGTSTSTSTSGGEGSSDDGGTDEGGGDAETGEGTGATGDAEGCTCTGAPLGSLPWALVPIAGARRRRTSSPR